MDKLNELSLCTGIAGISLGLRQTGRFRTICYSEIEANCIKILKGRIKDGLLDDAPIWGDLTKFNGRPWRGYVDIITGGFPCQPFSIAGSRLGEKDERHLWPHILRIIREVEPKWLLLENVPGLLNISSGRTIGRIFGDISESGYDAIWFVKDSQYFGVPQRRRRLFIVGYPRGTSGQKILSVFESCIWDTAPRREKRQEIAGTIGSRVGRYPDELDGHGAYIVNDISRALNCKNRIDSESETFVVSYDGLNQSIGKEINPCQCVAFQTNAGMELQVLDNHSGTLKAGQGPPSVSQNMTVRRLTPTECERLQGFPITWTKYGIDDKGNKIKMSDTARYKSLGNAVTVPVINWIGKKILECVR